MEKWNGVEFLRSIWVEYWSKKGKIDESNHQRIHEDQRGEHEI